MPLTLHDYPYIDTARLDGYVDQFASRSTTDKIPIWEVGLTLTGPSVKGTQNQIVRGLTSVEKIALLLRHLKEHEFLARGSPREGDDITGTHFEFRIDTLDATRVILPARKHSEMNFPSFAIWMGEYAIDVAPADILSRPGKGLLVLPEDLPPLDKRMEYISAFSSIYLLRDVLERQILQTVVGEGLLRKNREAEFLKDPVRALESLGAIATKTQRIEVLYKVRNGGARDRLQKSGPDFVTLGHPIAIATAGPLNHFDQPGKSGRN